MTPEELVAFSLYRRFDGHAEILVYIDDFLSGPTGMENPGDTEDWFQIIINLRYIRRVYHIFRTRLLHL